MTQLSPKSMWFGSGASYLPLSSARIGKIMVAPGPAIVPGLYHNVSKGLLSISYDLDNWITIADKNLGAVTTYESGDPLSEANCGYYFQRGNCYGFPGIGNSTPITLDGNTVDTTGYGPTNYYSSSTFITGFYNRSSPANYDLWGDITNTLEARRGPCNKGFHIPTYSEFMSLVTYCNNISINTTALRIRWLKLPCAGSRDRSSANLSSVNASSLFRCSNKSNSAGTYGQMFDVSNPSTYGGLSNYPNGYPIRPFKNVPVKPDSTWTRLY